MAKKTPKESAPLAVEAQRASRWYPPGDPRSDPERGVTRTIAHEYDPECPLNVERRVERDGVSVRIMNPAHRKS